MVFEHLGHFLTYYVTLNIETVCHHLNFDPYPFDSHECFLEMGSYTYNEDELVFTEVLEGNDIYNRKGFLTSDFLIDLEKLPIERTVSNYSYSKAGIQMNLRRNIEKYVFNYYMPSGLMVITSWVR